MTFLGARIGSPPCIECSRTLNTHCNIQALDPDGKEKQKHGSTKYLEEEEEVH